MSKILSALVIFLLMQSCSKINDVTTEPVIQEKIGLTSKSPQSQLSYLERNLKDLSTEIAKLALNKDFKDFVHLEVKKKFDYEYEVLIQDIFKENKWKSKENYSKVEQSLNALKNIDGLNLYPQIYIPKFQAIEDNGELNIGSNLGDNAAGDSIVYIYYAGDSEVDTATNENESYAGYVLNAQGQLEYWGMVNEEYANNNEVWIISFNESVNSQGYVCPFAPNGTQNFQECPGGGGGGGDNPPPPPPPGGCNGDPDCDPNVLNLIPHPDMGTHFPVNFKIEQMVVKEHHESWLAGASEIAIRAELNCHNNLALGKHANTGAVSTQYLSNQTTSRFTGNLISKFKRKQIKNGTIKYVQYSLQTNWPTQFYASDPVWFDYIIFERDIVPAKINRAPWGQHPGRVDIINLPYTGQFSTPWNLWYRSGGSKKGFNYYYSKGSFVSNNLISSGQDQYYATGYVNNSEISFNTKGY